MDLIALDVSGIVVDGSLLLAVPLAFLAGLVSFLSPCVLPLAPGYLAYVAGLTGSELADEADVNLTEQQDRSPGIPDRSSPGAARSTLGGGSTAIADASALDADVDVAGPATSAPVGADDTDTDLYGKQRSPLVGAGGFSPGASTESSAARPAGTDGAAVADHSLPDEASLADLPTTLVGVSEGGSIGGAQAGAPVAGSPVAGAQVAGAPVAGVGRGRVLAGASLFVLGFSVVFVSYGAAFGGLGAWLLGHSRQISVVMGIIVIILGLGYLGLPALSNRIWWNADRRSHARPARGLWGAPLLGILFGLGWTPCIGPTLAAVQTLAFTEASALRGATLSLAYCFGLGLPFIGMAVGLRAVAGATNWTKTHYLAISRFGGIMLMTIGVLLVTGWWNDVVAWLQGLVPGFTAVV